MKESCECQRRYGRSKCNAHRRILCAWPLSERQSSLLKRLQSELEAKGGAHVAAASDPHLAASAHTSTVQGDLTARADRIVNDRDEF